MRQKPDGICGYTWPDNNKIDDIPDHQGCCCRETLEDTNKCAWHADSGETVEKSMKSLQSARVDSEIRQQSSPFGELLDGAILTNLELNDTISLNRVALRDSDCAGATLVEVDLRGADLHDADLTGTNLNEAELMDANLLRVDLTDSYLSDADLTDSYLLDADLTEANLTNAKLIDSDLRFANLTDANLLQADLTDANLYKTNLINANLGGANLTNADLRDANLTNADLRFADLTNADLRDADLSGTNLRGTNLSDIDFRGCIINDVTVNGSTTCGKQTRAEGQAPTANDWDDIARAYHNLKTTFNEAGLIGKARKHYYLERRARGIEAKKSINRNWREIFRWLGSILSRCFIGYGVRLRTVGAWMLILFFGSTLVYIGFGVEETLIANFSYSVRTFTVAPPRAPTHLFPHIIMMIETFLGTLSIMLLGYVLSNREQF